jgi:hypothetical protein
MASNGRSSKAKGYAGEREYVEAAHEAGFTEAERNGSRFGSKDRGDIGGIRGWVVQVKNVAVPKIPEYLRDAKEQAANAGVARYCLSFKLRGLHMRHGVTILPNALWFEMVREREEMSDEIKVLRRLLRPEAGHSESP